MDACDTGSTNGPRELVLLDQARRALTEASSVDEVKDLRDKAAAVRAYARKARLGQHLIVEASAIKVRAERKLGEMLKNLPLAKGAPGNQHTGAKQRRDDNVLLAELGLSKSDSSRVQRLAGLPEAVFEQYIAENTDAGREPSSAGLLRLTKPGRARPEEPAVMTPGGHMVGGLDQLVTSGARFSTIYADPPWPFANQATRGATENHYPTMTFDAICDEPVEALCHDQAHLHLWTTNGFLLDAFEVLEAWGFTYKSCFIWVKPQLGLGNYWRVAHEFLLLGVRGGLGFEDRAQRSWIEAPRTTHSKKPDEVRKIIEQVSPPAYLEMYGRQRPDNDSWTVYGNEL